MMDEDLLLHSINISQYKSIICLNGTLPNNAFFAKYVRLPIIAVDGAANKLTALGIKYDMIIGDLDSVKPEILESHSVTIHLPSQEFSDFQKTITHLQKLQLLPSIILGINGGHIDHILHNINIFADLDCIFFAGSIIGKIVKNHETWQCNLPLMSKISLIALPQALVTTKGLKWELDKSALTFPGTNSYFNRTNQQEITITVENGKILVLIYAEDVTDAAIFWA